MFRFLCALCHHTINKTIEKQNTITIYRKFFFVFVVILLRAPPPPLVVYVKFWSLIPANSIRIYKRFHLKEYPFCYWISTGFHSCNVYLTFQFYWIPLFECQKRWILHKFVWSWNGVPLCATLTKNNSNPIPDEAKRSFAWKTDFAIFIAFNFVTLKWMPFYFRSPNIHHIPECVPVCLGHESLSMGIEIHIR